MKIGFIGLGNMAGTICQGLIKSDFIDGSEVYGYDINSQQLMMFEQDFGIHVCSSEQDVVKNCDYLVMGVKPNVVESVISKIKSVIGLWSIYVYASTVSIDSNVSFAIKYTLWLSFRRT